MTRPRSQLVSLSDTPFYHCMSRCVRRSFLHGQDKYSGQCFEHRRQWLIDRLKVLTNVFTIDIAAYAIMSNHYHLVICVDEKRAKLLGQEQVIERWTQLYKGGRLVGKKNRGEELSDVEITLLNQDVEKWRLRLSSLSWFLSCLNGFIARKANAEDKCSGRFWEGRFKSQALLDEKAVLACMTYVDLNPIRAAMSENIENSIFTSVHQRLHELKFLSEGREAEQTGPSLLPFIESENIHQRQGAIPYNLKQYFELVDYTGRQYRDDKRGQILNDEPRILDKLGMCDDQWQVLVRCIQISQISAIHGGNVLQRSIVTTSSS